MKLTEKSHNRQVQNVQKFNEISPDRVILKKSSRCPAPNQNIVIQCFLRASWIFTRLFRDDSLLNTIFLKLWDSLMIPCLVDTLEPGKGQKIIISVVFTGISDGT